MTKRRRGHGEGSIVQRADGRWMATVSVGWKDGKRDRKYYYGETRAAVAAKLNDALKAHHDGIPLANEKATVGRFLEEWLEVSKKGKLRARTFEGYVDAVQNHLIPDLGKVPLARLGPARVQRFLNEKATLPRSDARDANPLSPRSVQFMHAVLRNALKQAMAWGLVARNVATLVELPRVVRGEISPLTPKDAKAFLEATREHRNEAVYVVALSLGLRQGEALGLRWQDVDLEAGRLDVRRSLQRITGKGLQLEELKTERSRRSVRLPRMTIAALRAHKVRQAEERLAAGKAWKDHGLVFPSTIGTPLDARNVRRHFTKVLRSLKIAERRFHDLRHTAASFLLAQGADLRVIMETLGHSQISTTANVYAHVLDTLKQDVADKMDAILGTAS